MAYQQTTEQSSLYNILNKYYYGQQLLQLISKLTTQMMIQDLMYQDLQKQYNYLFERYNYGEKRETKSQGILNQHTNRAQIKSISQIDDVNKECKTKHSNKYMFFLSLNKNTEEEKLITNKKGQQQFLSSVNIYKDNQNNKSNNVKGQSKYIFNLNSGKINTNNQSKCNPRINNLFKILKKNGIQNVQQNETVNQIQIKGYSTQIIQKDDQKLIQTIKKNQRYLYEDDSQNLIFSQQRLQICNIQFKDTNMNFSNQNNQSKQSVKGQSKYVFNLISGKINTNNQSNSNPRINNLYKIIQKYRRQNIKQNETVNQIQIKDYSTQNIQKDDQKLIWKLTDVNEIQPISNQKDQIQKIYYTKQYTQEQHDRKTLGQVIINFNDEQKTQQTNQCKQLQQSKNQKFLDEDNSENLIFSLFQLQKIYNQDTKYKKLNFSNQNNQSKQSLKGQSKYVFNLISGKINTNNQSNSNPRINNLFKVIQKYRRQNIKQNETVNQIQIKDYSNQNIQNDDQKQSYILTNDIKKQICNIEQCTQEQNDSVSISQVIKNFNDEQKSQLTNQSEQLQESKNNPSINDNDSQNVIFSHQGQQISNQEFKDSNLNFSVDQNIDKIDSLQQCLQISKGQNGFEENQDNANQVSFSLQFKYILKIQNRQKLIIQDDDQKLIQTLTTEKEIQPISDQKDQKQQNSYRKQCPQEQNDCLIISQGIKNFNDEFKTQLTNKSDQLQQSKNQNYLYEDDQQSVYFVFQHQQIRNLEFKDTNLTFSMDQNIDTLDSLELCQQICKIETQSESKLMNSEQVDYQFKEAFMSKLQYMQQYRGSKLTKILMCKNLQSFYETQQMPEIQIYYEYDSIEEIQHIYQSEIKFEEYHDNAKQVSDLLKEAFISQVQLLPKQNLNVKQITTLVKNNNNPQYPNSKDKTLQMQNILIQVQYLQPPKPRKRINQW